MTIIAVKNGIMASDSKCTDDYFGFLTKCQKIYRLDNGALLGTAGDGDCRSLIALLSRSRCTMRTVSLPTKEQLAETKTGFHGILAFPNGRTFMVYLDLREAGDSAEWDGQIVEMEEGVCAVGSGYQYALGAMRAGATAAQAVAAACHYDSFCGLPVRQEPIKPLKA